MTSIENIMSLTMKKQWTPEEEDEMLMSMRKGDPFQAIAQQHGRTENAIRLRFGLICKKQLETKTIQDIGRDYRVSPQKVQQCIDALEDIQDKNKNKASMSAPNNNIQELREEIQKLHDKIDRIYKHVRKLADKKKE